MMTAAGPVALVTGASSGIGKATALALVAAGFEVVGSSRDTSRVAPLDGVSFVELDVAGDASVTTAVGQVIDRFGRIDVLPHLRAQGRGRVRYTAGSLAGRASTLRRVVPARAFDRQIRKLNQLAG